MLPEDIQKKIQEIRVVGNFEEKYNSPDDEQVLQTILAEQNMSIPSGNHTADWSSVKQVLDQKKQELKKRSEEYFESGFW
ncbi:hypothetical protein [Brevibacillus sp. SYSU BS000544]|uniref:hypothetical protein n=1 Tax=Brevibacillus sp. SYSU BS000544 TaxID=3416443 RepID=UPI003CE44E1B